MANDTVITVIGNLTADPELRFTPSGAPVANDRTIVAGTPPKWANARRWQSKNVARSWAWVKQTNGSRE